jgi:hypothetical protein
MDPRSQFCHSATCSARGRAGTGNLGGRREAERRYVGHACGKDSEVTQGVPCYRLETGRTW